MILKLCILMCDIFNNTKKINIKKLRRVKIIYKLIFY